MYVIKIISVFLYVFTAFILSIQIWSIVFEILLLYLTFKLREQKWQNLTPNVYAPTRMFQLFIRNRIINDFIDISRNSSPSLQQIFRSVACTITSLSPVRDKFARHFQCVILFQTKFLATSGTSASFVGRFGFRCRFVSFYDLLHRWIINRILYTVWATLHRGLRLLNYHLFVLPLLK